MENEGEQPPSSGITGSSSGGGGGGGGSGGGSTRPQVPQMSLYERQAVQALQALQRQPNAAAQYLQQMYAAQHQQLMLQQHLSSAQLQNLAAVQQVTLAANRQVNSANGSEGQSSAAAQSTVNLATTAVSQPSVRPQTVSSPVTSVLLGPTSSPSLSPSQAKMYLQAQVVARTLTRSAPLTHQLILMPGGSVAAVQPDLTAAGSGTHCETDQAQNLAVRGQGQLPLGASAKVSSVVVSQPSTVSPAQTVTITQASSLNLSQSASGQPQPSAKVVPSAQGDGEAGARKTEHESTTGSPSGGINLTRTVTPAGHTLISSAATYTQIQPHPLLHQQLQQKQLVIQQQHLAIHQHRQSQLAQLHLSQAHPTPHTQTLVVQPLSQAQTEAHKQAQTDAQRPAQAQTDAQKQAQAQAQTEAQKQAQAQAQAQTEAQKQAQAQTEAQKQVQAQAEAQKQAQAQTEAQPEAQRPAQAQTEAQKQTHTQSETQKQAQTQTEAPKQTQSEAQRPAQAQAEASKQAQAHPEAQKQGQAHPHTETEACTLPQKQAQTEVCPRQAQGKAPPAKGQASSSSSQLPTSAKPVSGPGGGGAGQGQGQASSAGTPAPVLQNSTSTQTPVSGLSLTQGPTAQAQDWTQPQVEPACPQLHLPLKSAVMGVKRKAEDDEEELAFSNLGPPELSPSLSTAQDLKQPTPGKGDTIHSGPPVLTSVTSLLKVSRHGGDSKPPQAIVKPHILTHVIEGFVIQEGAEPFPANCKQKPQEPPVLQPETQLSSQQPDPEPLQQPGSEVGPEMLKCEFCGRLEQAEKFKRSKRFCSMACAKRYNVSCRKGVRRFTVERAGPIPKETATRLARRSSRKDSGDALRTPLHKRLAKGTEESGRVSDNSSYEEVLSPSLGLHRQPPFERETSGCGSGLQELTGVGAGLGSANPALWSVQQVHEFIASLPGCQDLAEEFQLQEIDGQALLLLKEEHLMTTMNMKLGPALKICARINMLKEA